MAQVVIPPSSLRNMEVGETTPLLLSEEDAHHPPLLQDLKAESLKEKTVTAVAGVNFILALLTLLFQSSMHPVVWISSILGLLVSPLAAVQQRKLTEVEAMTQCNARLEEEVKVLQLSNTKLQQSLQQMEESVYQLQAMQQTLETLQDLEGQSMDDLERQLQESKQILAGMSTNYKGQVLQQMFTVLCGVDEDGDLILSDADIDEIITRIEGLENIHIKQDLFRKFIVDKGRSVEAIMGMAKEALLTNESHAEDAGDVIFKFFKADE